MVPIFFYKVEINDGKSQLDPVERIKILNLQHHIFYGGNFYTLNILPSKDGQGEIFYIIFF